MKKLCLLLVFVFILSGCSSGNSAATEETREYTTKQVTGLTQNLDERYVLMHPESHRFIERVRYKSEVVKGVEADISQVDFEKPGDYEVTYFITVDCDAMDQYLNHQEIEEKEHPISVSVVEKKGTVKVLNEAQAKETYQSGKQVLGIRLLEAN